MLNGDSHGSSTRAEKSKPEATTPQPRKRKTNTKRARGLISCAECARLKVRCDKNIPCGSCVRRGCSTICPSGVLSGKQGTRYVLANTEALHDKIREMCERIRQLEDALAILQATTTSDPHPLLREELLAVKKGIEVTVHNSEDEDPEMTVADGLGTLSISEKGVSRFIGRTGGLESLMVASAVQYANSLEDEDTEGNVTSINNVPVGALIDEIRPQLPSFERASTLCETYLSHATWLMRPLLREQLINDLLMPVYKGKPSDGSNASLNNSHELALLLFVFAIGSSADLTLAPHNDEGKLYYRLGFSLLNLESIITTPSLATVQSLCLLANYQITSDNKNSREKSWSLLRITAALASSIGLHRDPSKWNLDAKTSRRRREVYWQIYALESGQSLSNGRPPICSVHYSDCRFPVEPGEISADEDEIETSFWRWRFMFAKEITRPLAEIGCQIKPIKYSDVLELDRKIRNFDAPPNLRGPLENFTVETEGVQVCMQRGMVSALMDITLMYLHRGFYAKALIEYSKDPMSSPFAPSFLATYRCALSSLQCIRWQFKMCPDIMLRTWAVWKHGFPALVVLGSLVLRAPHSNLVPSALKELEFAMQLFKNAADNMRAARYAHSVLVTLHEHALNAYKQYRNGQRRVIDGQVVNPEETVKAWERELAIFSGQTTLLEPRSSPSTRSSSAGRGSNASSNSDNDHHRRITPETSRVSSAPATTQINQDANMSFSLPVSLDDIPTQFPSNESLFTNGFFDSLNDAQAFNDNAMLNDANGYPDLNFLMDGMPNGVANDPQSSQYIPLSYSDYADMLGVQFGQGHEMAQDWSALLQKFASSDPSQH